MKHRQPLAKPLVALFLASPPVAPLGKKKAGGAFSRLVSGGPTGGSAGGAFTRLGGVPGFAFEGSCSGVAFAGIGDSGAIGGGAFQGNASGSEAEEELVPAEAPL